MVTIQSVATIQSRGESLGYVTSSQEKLYDDRNGPEIDLGLGNSPIGAARELKNLLHQRDPFEDLTRYPKDPFHTETAQIIIDGIGLQEVKPDAIVFNGNGSYGAGDELIRYFKSTGINKLYAPSYSFPNVHQWTERHNMEYIPVVTEELNPISAQEHIMQMRDQELKDSVVYIDYPNNPFGIANPQLVRDIVNKVEKAGGIPLVDLAFGEVLGDEYREMIQYVYDHNGAVLGSISKTQGLPSLRCGYTILAEKYTNDGFSRNKRLVFGLNHEAETVLQILYSKPVQGGETIAQVHAKRVKSYNTETNKQLYEALSSLGLVVAPTNLETQIQVVISNYPDFYQRLRKQGLITESLKDYGTTLGNDSVRGYGDSAVRLLTPKPGELDEVIRRITLAIQN